MMQSFDQLSQKDEAVTCISSVDIRDEDQYPDSPPLERVVSAVVKWAMHCVTPVRGSIPFISLPDIERCLIGASLFSAPGLFCAAKTHVEDSI